MSTRNLICFEKAGIIKAMYCHHDGDLRCNGRILLDRYNRPAQVEKLVNLGSISSLHETYEETKKTQHSDYNEVAEYDSFTKFFKSMADNWDIEYFYLYLNKEWIVFSPHFPHDEKDKNFMAQGYELEKLLNN